MNQQRGFTLLEALITLAILGVGLTGTAKLQSLVFARMLDARAQNEAVQFTMEEIEQLRYQSRYAGAELALPLRNTLRGAHSFYRMQAVETSGDSGSVRQLDFTTRWSTPGSDGSLSVSTLFTEEPYSEYFYRLNH